MVLPSVRSMTLLLSDGKVCIRCAVEKPRAEYYAHPQMADGLLGACKACVKEGMRIRRRTNPKVQEYDRARGHRLRPGYIKERRLKFPEMAKAHDAVAYAVRMGRLKKEPCLFCEATENIHGHHRDYAKPLDVVWLCAKCHTRLHNVFPETAAHEPKP